MASAPRNLTQQFVQMLHAFRLSGEASSFLNTILAEIGWNMNALKQSGAVGENAATHLKKQMRPSARMSTEAVTCLGMRCGLEEGPPELTV